MSTNWLSSLLGSQPYLSGFFTFKFLPASGKLDLTPARKILPLCTFGAAELLQIEVQHSCQALDKLWSHERLNDFHGEVVEHVHRFSGQREVGSALSFVLEQLSLPSLLLVWSLLLPGGSITHCFLHLMDSLKIMDFRKLDFQSSKLKTSS